MDNLIDDIPRFIPPVSISVRPAKGEWISVDDNLPEIGQWYLVIDNFLIGKDKQTMGFLDSAGSETIWLPLDQREDEYGMAITHWMPLPEPPN